jgi:hypothetical protein
MDSLVKAWGFFLLVSVFVFPHLLGILLFYRLNRAPGWIARIAAILAPAALFFWLAPILFFAGLREAAARGEMNCGMPAVAAGIILLFGTGVQIVVGLITHAVLAARRK